MDRNHRRVVRFVLVLVLAVPALAHPLDSRAGDCVDYANPPWGPGAVVEPLGLAATPDSAVSVAAWGSLVFVSQRNHLLTTFDVSDPRSPVSLSTVTRHLDATGLLASPPYVMLTYRDGLVWYDSSVPTHTMPFGTPHVGDFGVIDVSDPHTPRTLWTTAARG